MPTNPPLAPRYPLNLLLISQGSCSAGKSAEACRSRTMSDPSGLEYSGHRHRPSNGTCFQCRNRKVRRMEPYRKSRGYRSVSTGPMLILSRCAAMASKTMAVRTAEDWDSTAHLPPLRIRTHFDCKHDKAPAPCHAEGHQGLAPNVVSRKLGVPHRYPPAIGARPTVSSATTFQVVEVEVPFQSLIHHFSLLQTSWPWRLQLAMTRLYDTGLLMNGIPAAILLLVTRGNYTSNSRFCMAPPQLTQLTITN